MSMQHPMDIRQGEAYKQAHAASAACGKRILVNDFAHPESIHACATHSFSRKKALQTHPVAVWQKVIMGFWQGSQAKWYSVACISKGH